MKMQLRSWILLQSF